MCLGEAELARGAAGEAAATLERALALADGMEAAERGQIRFALARALWQLGRDRTRAVELATRARRDYESMARADEEVARVSRWLESR